MMLNASTAAIYTTWHWLPQWTRRKHWLQIEVLTPDMKWILLVFVVPSSILSLLIRQEAKYFANFTLIDQSLGHFVRTQWCINDEIGWYKVQRMGGTENYLELFFLPLEVFHPWRSQRCNEGGELKSLTTSSSVVHNRPVTPKKRELYPLDPLSHRVLFCAKSSLRWGWVFRTKCLSNVSPHCVPFSHLQHQMWNTDASAFIRPLGDSPCALRELKRQEKFIHWAPRQSRVATSSEYPPMCGSWSGGRIHQTPSIPLFSSIPYSCEMRVHMQMNVKFSCIVENRHVLCI